MASASTSIPSLNNLHVADFRRNSQMQSSVQRVDHDDQRARFATFEPGGTTEFSGSYRPPKNQGSWPALLNVRIKTMQGAPCPLCPTKFRKNKPRAYTRSAPARYA